MYYINILYNTFKNMHKYNIQKYTQIKYAKIKIHKIYKNKNTQDIQFLNLN